MSEEYRDSSASPQRDAQNVSDSVSTTPSPQNRLNRRVTRKGMLIGAVGATGVLGAAGVAAFHPLSSLAHASPTRQSSDDTSGDTPLQIFTAALIAEDLATTFYYNGLVGAVIHDPNLAGPGGSALHPDQPPNGNPGNVDYLRAALGEEVDHANLMRQLTGGTSSAGDPVQTFYFPTGTFTDLNTFLAVLNGLESAFIGAYLAATKEFAQMAADTKAGIKSYPSAGGKPYSSVSLEFFSEVAASILGVESEHRTLGRVIGNANPANNLRYEQMDGITSVYNGSSSAVVALTPFITSGSGKVAASFATAIQHQGDVSDPNVSGGLPDEQLAQRLGISVR